MKTNRDTPHWTDPKAWQERYTLKKPLRPDRGSGDPTIVRCARCNAACLLTPLNARTGFAAAITCTHCEHVYLLPKAPRSIRDPEPTEKLFDDGPYLSKEPHST